MAALMIIRIRPDPRDYPLIEGDPHPFERIQLPKC